MKLVLKNTGLVIIWILGLLIALFPARYINNIFGYGAFFFILFLFIFSIVILLVLRRNIKVETKFQGDISTLRGESVDLGLNIKNQSIFYCNHALACFYISDLFGQVDSSLESDFVLAPKSETPFEFDADMNHIGVYQVGITRLTIYDMFDCFSLQVPVHEHFEVQVKPRIYAIEDLHVEEEVLHDSDKETRHTTTNGTDYVGVREYTPGDAMKQIHWKLSAHSLTYMTKLSENSRQSDYAVVLDFATNEKDHENMMDLYDCLIETAFSLIEALSHKEVTYSLIYPNKQLELCRSIPRSRETDMDYIRRFALITNHITPDFPDATKILDQEAHMPNRSTNVMLCTSRITPELVREIISIKRQKRSIELNLICLDALTTREREDLVAPLRDLEDYQIPWHLITTAINRQGATS